MYGLPISTLGHSDPTAMVSGIQSLTAQEDEPLSLKSLPPELLNIIKSVADQPTRDALSWTCRQFRLAHKEPFDGLRFADECAEFGYSALLEWSIERGARFDAKTAEIAGKFGNVEMLAMYLRKKHQYDVSPQPLGKAKVLSAAVFRTIEQWADSAALTGCQRTFNWLIAETDLWQSFFQVAKPFVCM